MEKVFIIFSSLLFFTSCGNNADTKEISIADSTTAKIEVKDPEAAKGLELITKSDCFTCHKLTDASIGPPYSAVAAKYKIINETTMDSMVTQINKGGKGKWGNIPMTPHPAISKEDAQSMVHYIMSIKK
jgi:cytochrome c